MKNKLLETFIRNVLQESFEDIADIEIRARIHIVGKNLPTLRDVLTDVRGYKNVITVRQQGNLTPPDPNGRQTVNFVVGFEDDEEYDVKDLVKDIRNHPQIDMIHVISVDNRHVYDSDGNAIIV